MSTSEWIFMAVLLGTGGPIIITEFVLALRRKQVKNPFGSVAFAAAVLRIDGETRILTRAASPMAYWIVVSFWGFISLLMVVITPIMILVYLGILK
jgi:hypothetical protein